MIALIIPRGSSNNTTCQLIFLFYLFSTLLTIAYAYDTNTNNYNDNKHRAILIPRQEDPEWIEGDGDEGDATATDNYEDPSTETYQATDAYDDGSVPTTTDDWQDPTTTDAWQDPTTTDDWQDPTTTDAWQDPTTTDDWQDPTTTDDWQDPTTTDDWQDPTTTDDWQDPTTTDDWQDPTTTESVWTDPTTEPSLDPTSSENAEESSTESAAIPITTTTEQQETTSAPETTDVTQSSSMDEQPTTTTQRTFSVTSSTATPSLVLGSNECADDPIAVNGKCPSDHFCNAALKQCNALNDNGGQCYEDFQCKSGYCNSRSCGDEPDNEASNLSGGQIAGITVGSIAGAVLLVGALMWCQKRRSRQVSTRARKFEQIRTEDEDLESVGVMRDTGNRTSKYNLLTSLMTGTAVGRSLSRMGGGYSGTSRSMNSQAYLSHSPQPAMSESSVPYSSTSGNGTDNNRAAAYGAGAAVVGGAALAGATHSDNNRQSKLEQPIDPTIYEDQQYYGNLAVGTSDNQNDDNRQALTQTQQQLQQQLAKHDDPYRMSQASAIDPFGAATAYNNATRPSTSIERPPTTVLRESTFNNLHAPIFHISAPQDDKTVPAGGGAYVPQLASAGNEQTQQSPEMDAFGGGKRGSWLLKEIAARWQQGSATGARASGVTTTTDASSINNEAINNNNSDNNNVNISPTKQLSPVVDNNNTHGALWDDGLVSAGGSSVARSASTASTNPFRSSLSNPRDSVISALRIPPIQEDAWTLEDHVSLSGDNNKTVTKENSSNDTSTQQQQHEHQETK